MFADTALARSIEASEARQTLAVGTRHARGRDDVIARELSGGVIVSAGGSSPFDKAIGLGFEPLDRATFVELEREILERGRRVLVELSTLAEPEVAIFLTGRGYRLVGFEHVLAAVPAAAPPVPGVTVRSVEAHENSTWIDIVTAGFLTPDAGTPAHETFDREALHRVFHELDDVPGMQRMLAYRHGELAGGASLRIDGAIAQLAGASTLPAHRNHGVQTALLRHRLELAARAGCELAVVTTEPGSRSHRNASRTGFVLLYARAVLRRTPDHHHR